MADILLPSVMISIFYFILQFFQQKRKDKVDMKALSNDSIFVFISSGLTLFLYHKLYDMFMTTNSVPDVFTDNPNF